MPELPDITVYAERVQALAGGTRLDGVRLVSPFLLRTVEPPLSAFVGRRLVAARRVAKQVVLDFEGGLHLVIHLMLAGRLHWRRVGAGLPGKAALAAFDFASGALLLLEHGSKRRASLHAVHTADLDRFHRGGLDPLTASAAEVAARLVVRHTLKRSLTDPTLFDGIGGAFADEILHAARLSPVAWSDKVDDGAVATLTTAMREVLTRATEQRRAEAKDGFPEKVTAFHDDMAVHGRFGQPCRVCSAPIQRIVHGDRETNYCPGCQTGGRLLADRALSALLKQDWPRTLEELEAVRRW